MGETKFASTHEVLSADCSASFNVIFKDVLSRAAAIVETKRPDLKDAALAFVEKLKSSGKDEYQLFAESKVTLSRMARDPLKPLLFTACHGDFFTSNFLFKCGDVNENEYDVVLLDFQGAR